MAVKTFVSIAEQGRDLKILRSRCGAEWVVVNACRAVDTTLASVELVSRSDADTGHMERSFRLPAAAFQLFCCANGINGRP